MPKDEINIASMTGDQLVQYLNTLSMRQAEFSRLKIRLNEELIPIDQARAAKRAEIQNVNERQRQCRIEIAACKYGIKAEQQ